MDKSEKLGQLKECICKIEEDITMSCKNGCPDKETLMNRNILECLKYISELLDDTISESSSNTPQTRKRFFITDEQCKQLQITGNAMASEISDELNRVTKENGIKKFQAVWITDWLLDIGFLQKSADNKRFPTQCGKEIGITSKLKRRSDGSEYYLNLYSEKAQRFIYDNLETIITFHYSKKQKFKTEYKLLDYPVGKSIKDFVNENFTKCIIISVGSCNTYLENGSYHTIITYKGKNKFLHNNNIKTRSANKCILYGLKDAVNAIKQPTDVILLASTALGFRSHQSTNYNICREIIDILKEKDCTINITTCEGMGEELRKFIFSL